MDLIIPFDKCSYSIKNNIGGKNASLGELMKLSRTNNFNVADGFAVSTLMYDEFMEQNNISEGLEDQLKLIDIENIADLQEKSEQLREKISTGQFNENQIQLIKRHYEELCNKYAADGCISVAVRSSAIAEDMPNASFAGQQDTFLHVSSFDELIICIKKCFASLFNARAISYRASNDIHYSLVKLSVGVQKMVRSDIGSAGVAFSLDTETGYSKAVIINSSFGLGEGVVSGLVNPDEIILDKRVLSTNGNKDPIIMKKCGSKEHKIIYNPCGSGTIEIENSMFERSNFSLHNEKSLELGRIILGLESSYSKLFGYECAVDVEWGLDGRDGRLYILQTRPETVHSTNKSLCMENYSLVRENNVEPHVLATGVSVGSRISNGTISVIYTMKDHHLFVPGNILVTDMTTPDWEPIMKKASGIITNKGGRTCHAAIVAREMGLNAIVGVGNATTVLCSNMNVTMCCSQGETGYVYEGLIDYKIDTIEFDSSKELPVNLMLNVGNPESSFNASLLPNSGVGLARLEFIISNYIKMHPLALCDYPNVDEPLRSEMFKLLGTEHEDGKTFFIRRLARGISKIASAFYPNPIIVRLSDFKSNEYKNLLGGSQYEPVEENPMIGWRGASRYYNEDYKHAFALECQAIKYAREVMHMTNIIVMIPFCRTPEECKQVIDTMSSYGLVRGENGLQVYLMCEIPSNVIEADRFSKYIDGVSIGGNDLLQLTLGIDRDSEKIAELSDHTNISYRRMIKMAIETYKSYGIKVGFCGQQPSDSTEFAQFLIDSGIDSISVVPESALHTLSHLGSSKP